MARFLLRLHLHHHKGTFLFSGFLHLFTSLDLSCLLFSSASLFFCFSSLRLLFPFCFFFLLILRSMQFLIFVCSNSTNTTTSPPTTPAPTTTAPPTTTPVQVRGKDGSKRGIQNCFCNLLRRVRFLFRLGRLIRFHVWFRCGKLLRRFRSLRFLLLRLESSQRLESRISHRFQH